MNNNMKPGCSKLRGYPGKAVLPALMFDLLSLMLLCCACSNNGVVCNYPDQKVILAEGMETDALPVPDPKRNAVKAARYSHFFVTEGIRTLELDCSFNKDSGTLPLTLNGNWPGIQGIVLDVYSTLFNTVELRARTWADNAPGQQQSNRVLVNPGKNIDLRLCLNPAWFKAARGNAETARKMITLVFKGSQGITGKVFIDNVRLAYKDAPAGKPAVTPVAGGEPGRITILNPAALEKDCPLYTLLEIDCKIDGTFKNPYDPAEISLDGIFTSAGNAQYTVPGFYYIPYTRTTRGSRDLFLAAGDGYWKVRFTPVKTGKWTFRLAVAGSSGSASTPELSFTVADSAADGFVRRPAAGERYFRFDSGKIYLPVGANVAWYDGRETSSYMKWFYKMAENGANYARIWLAGWGFEFEWNDTGLGDYTNRQTKAWQLDYTFKLAEEKGIRIMLCLLNHGRFSTGTNPEWDKNPYNKVNGGPLAKPRDFLTDPAAQQMFKRKLRYLTARWGYSTSLFSWELWNEVNLADQIADHAQFVPWINEMTAYLRSIDPYRHLVSSSYSTAITGTEPAWENLDYVQVHKYNSQNWARYINSMILKVREASTKPVLLSEFGIQDEITDPGGIHFHNGMWSALFAGSAGTGMLWWWDTYIDPNGLYYHYRGISAFFKNEDPVQDTLLPAKMEKLDAAEVYKLTGKNKALLWIKNKDYSYEGLLDLAISAGDMEAVQFPAVDGFELQLPELDPGLYRIEKWYTTTGQAEKSEERLFSGKVSIPVESFDTDVAYKVVRVGE